MADTILIVEDNEKNMKLARDVLQFDGFQTLEAATAEAGLALRAGAFAGHHPDGRPASRSSTA